LLRPAQEYDQLSLPFCAFLVFVAMRETLSQPMLWSIIELNALWTVDSIVLLMSRWTEPTAFGKSVVLIQAFCVAGFAYLEYIGLRKSTAASA
jgi:hypothetical protein